MTDKVLNFQKKREENIEKKRRNFERVLFRDFIGASSTITQDEGAIIPIELVDVSRDGVLFQIPFNVIEKEQFIGNEEIGIRMYFTKESYLPIVVTIRNSREYIDTDGNAYMQYGCEFDKTLPAFDALNNFINFMYGFAEHSTIDHGDKKIFYI